MRKNFLLVAALFLIFVTSFACSGGTKAVRLSSGEKITVFVISNRGNPKEMTEKQFKWRNEVGTYMEANLINIFNRAGYMVRLINERGEFTPGPGRYLLDVTIVSYNPGSSAARMLVGYGAGAASLDNHYKFFGEEDKPLMMWDDGVGSSKGWRPCVMKLNKNTFKKVSDKLKTIHR